VLLASCASPSSHSAGQVVLSLSESTLLDAVTSELALEECRRNLERKLPGATETFEFLVRRSLDAVPAPSKETVRRHAGRADWRNVPHLACALKHGCACLMTYNTKEYAPGHPDVQIVRPVELVRRVREQLTGL